MYKINFRVNVTEYCNFNCDYCIEKSQQAKNRYNDFNIEKTLIELDKAIEENEKQGVFVSFFGGEPTLKKDKIMDFLNILKNKKYFNKLRFELTTNAFIYFPEIIEFCKENNSLLKLMISYDAIGQNYRNKDENVNKIVENNIIKYIELFKKLEINTYFINVNCCVVEKNCNTIFESYMKLLKLGFRNIKFTPVFSEHWSQSSFTKIKKEQKKIYDYVIKYNNIHKGTHLIPAKVEGGHKDEWKKFNALFYQTKNDKELVKKIEFSEIYVSKIIERRYSNKKHYRVQPLFLDKKIAETQDIELNTLKMVSMNHTFFDKLTMTLLLGDNIKRYKHELYQLFNFDVMLCNRYKNAIKRIIKNNPINIFDFLLDTKIYTYLLKKIKIDKFKQLEKALNKNLMYNVKDKYYVYIDDISLEISKDSVKNNSLIKVINKKILIYKLKSELDKLNITVDDDFINMAGEMFYKYIYKIRTIKIGD